MTGRPPDARRPPALRPPLLPTAKAAGQIPSDEPITTDSETYRPDLFGGPSNRISGPDGEPFTVGVASVANGTMAGSSSAPPSMIDPPMTTDAELTCPTTEGGWVPSVISYAAVVLRSTCLFNATRQALVLR
eukprot:CAMPEP_0195588286 /NCGR_PEP_ID=MMETSP0814-20130614/32408_1 /TAXON_ID=97485 /ORGANISM="Prymnesium parvum, Strain Texoma1" /LENGTH=131 /DNA_ID=CAMNT_0040727213 /DNA_START=32 /DNA_END=424 /DNA_ORIENTATION=-